MKFEDVLKQKTKKENIYAEMEKQQRGGLKENGRQMKTQVQVYENVKLGD